MCRHKNTLRRIEQVAMLTARHYEAGRLDRCYKAVWRKYIYPVYPMDYRTYLRYLGVNYKRELKQT